MSDVLRTLGKWCALYDNLVKVGVGGLVGACLALGAIVVSPSIAAPIDSDSRLALQDRSTPETPETPSVEDRFAGAPDGVDPVVTGPVSAEFKQTRNFLGCDKAEWPNVPAGCYPN